MDSVRSAEESVSPSVLSIEYTHLPDITLYTRNTASIGMTAACATPAWAEIIDKLAGQFPDVLRRDLALTVFAIYAARMSETNEAVFPLQLSGLATRTASFTPCSIALAPEDRFEDALGKVLRALLRAVSSHEPCGVADPAALTSLTVTVGSNAVPHAGSQLHLHCHDDGEISLWHANNVQPEATSLITERMVALAQGVVTDPNMLLVRQPIMSARERKLVVQDWNATDKFYSYDGGLIAMMEQAASSAPDHPALIYMDTELSFADFNSRVNRLARLLRSKGVGKDQFVCLCMDRSLEMVIGLWATLKAGGAYVPLNVDDPVSRINEIVDDCRPKVLLTQAHIRDRIDTEATDVIVLSEGCEGDPAVDDGDLGLAIGENDLAYMIYTSGSTGKPKGVVVEHGAIHNRVVWMHEEYGLSPEDRVLQKTPYTFDVSVWEFLWSFSVGSTLVVAEPGGHTAISYLYRLIRDAGVTHLHFVPSVMRMFLIAPALEQLPIKKLFCSGEALGFDLVTSFYEKANGTAEVHNLYGPTEAAVDVSYFACPRDPADNTIPIGRPVSNTGLYVLDEFDQPVPVGVPGELHIGGVQLARGYWAREDLTAEKFIPCPVEDAQHERLYRTGDLAFFRPDGQIIYLGRNDFQVKVNGVRIELGEIETAIREQDGVEDVVVVAEENAGNKILVAYVVAETPSTAEAERLKAGVAATRPVYYVPKDVRFIAKMPLTVSGKINRKALAAQTQLGMLE
ncbi:MAG: amino acid adenylation domain-containing protein [Pseudomonadota bacterium]